MSTAFVLGNGVSRQNIDLTTLSPYGKIYGCNAVYREYTPDVLVSTDRPIATHIQESGYSAQHRFYTRRPIPGLGAQAVPKPYFGFSSGPIATPLAAQDGNTCIYLLGFDMGPTANNTINNLYAGTEFYKETGSSPTYTGNWIKQIQHICREFAEIKFVRVCGRTTARLTELDGIRNMEHLPLERFVERINNVKDL
jgi:hypothetical protein